MVCSEQTGCFGPNSISKITQIFFTTIFFTRAEGARDIYVYLWLKVASKKRQGSSDYFITTQHRGSIFAPYASLALAFALALALALAVVLALALALALPLAVVLARALALVVDDSQKLSMVKFSGR